MARPEAWCLPVASHQTSCAQVADRLVHGRLAVGVETPVVPVESTRRNHLRYAHGVSLSPKESDEIVGAGGRLGSRPRRHAVVDGNGDDEIFHRAAKVAHDRDCLLAGVDNAVVIAQSRVNSG